LAPLKTLKKKIFINKKKTQRIAKNHKTTNTQKKNKNNMKKLIITRTIKNYKNVENMKKLITTKIKINKELQGSKQIQYI
jgi:hypothetical protein